MRLSHVLAALAIIAFAGGTASAQTMTKATASPSSSIKSGETMNKTTASKSMKKSSSMKSSSTKAGHMMAQPSPKPSANP